MLRKYFLGLFLIFFPLLASADRSMIIETLSGENGATEYQVDDKILSFDQLGDALNQWLLVDPGDKNKTHIAVLTGGKTPLSVLYNLNGLVKQVGFNGPRFFYMAENSTKLSEIQINHRPLIMKDELESMLATKQP